MTEIMEIARRRQLTVVEDCAQSHGARHGGQMTGTFGNAACFSFYPGKNLGAYGDGGAVVTDSDQVFERLLLLRNHGQVSKYDHRIVGYCHRLDGIQAAVLSVKLPHLADWNAARQAHACRYGELLADVPGIVIPHTDARNTHVHHLYVIQVRDGRRDELQRYLGTKGISTGLHYPVPVHLTGAYASLGHRDGDFPVSEALSRQGLSLPMFAELEEAELVEVASAIREFMTRR
jgi:dTDP-4-amino-4,6-dideoxygalactose transaminase